MIEKPGVWLSLWKEEKCVCVYIYIYIQTARFWTTANSEIFSFFQDILLLHDQPDIVVLTKSKSLGFLKASGNRNACTINGLLEKSVRCLVVVVGI